MENMIVLTKPMTRLLTALTRLTLRHLLRFRLRLPIVVRATLPRRTMRPARAGLSTIESTERMTVLPRTLILNTRLTLNLKNL